MIRRLIIRWLCFVFRQGALCRSCGCYVGERRTLCFPCQRESQCGSRFGPYAFTPGIFVGLEWNEEIEIKKPAMPGRLGVFCVKSK